MNTVVSFSGLDAFSIKQCMGILNVLKEQGRTVIFTIDQPSDKTFQSFDQVYIKEKDNLQIS